MVDLQAQYLQLKSEIDTEINQVLSDANFIKGKQVSELELQLAKFIEIENCVTCANGTDALQLALMALDLPKDCEILVPDFCYVAAAEAICSLGFKPVFVDIDYYTFNIDTSKIEENITDNTRAIIPVHLFGQCCEMTKIIKIAQKYNLYIIEDVAQSLGAKYILPNGETRMAGNLSHIATTSFFPSKNLGCYGDGGAIFTNDEHLAKKIRSLANHGQLAKYNYEFVGLNSRLDTLQAAILLAKLPNLEVFNNSRFKSSEKYTHLLSGISQIELPKISTNSTHIFHQYTLRVLNGKRDKLKAYLESKQIPTMIYYPKSTSKQNAYKQFAQNLNLNTEDAVNEVLSLPMHPNLELEQMEYICDNIVDFFK